MTVWKMVALVLSLGMDTLIMSVSLGLAKGPGKFRIALTFAAAEAFMPLVGLLVGQGAGDLVGQWASMLGGLALMGVAVWIIFLDHEGEEEHRRQRDLVGWTFIMAVLSVSLDELAVGFSIGLVGVPIGLTLVLIGLQAFVFTFVGIALGKNLKRLLGTWSESFVGIVLGLLGIWITIDAVARWLRP